MNKYASKVLLDKTIELLCEVKRIESKNKDIQEDLSTALNIVEKLSLHIYDNVSK